MEQQKKYDFFLCYGRRDLDLVQPWAATLAHYGFSCFMDMTRLQSGDEFITKIMDSIKQSRALLYFASPNANSSSWAQRELEYAHTIGTKIILISINNYQDQRFLFLYGLKDALNYDVNIPVHLQDGFEKLIRNFKQWYPDRESETIVQDESIPAITPKEAPAISLDIPSQHKKSSRLRFLPICLLVCGIIALLSIGVSDHLDALQKGQKKSPSELADMPLEAINKERDQGVDSVVSHIDEAIECAEDEDNDDETDNFLWLPNPDFVSNHDGPNGGYNDIPPINLYVSLRAVWVLGITTTLLSIVLITLSIIYLLKRKSYSIRLYNQKANGPIEIYLDGDLQDTIEAGVTKNISAKRGEYAVLVQSTLDQEKYLEFVQNFSKNDNNKLITLKFEENTDHRNIEKQASKIYRCFIGGSTKIVHERNAARAVLSKLYNQFDNKDFRITAHTFEDFSQKHKDQGHQNEYDNFIRLTADCAIFIICEKVGTKTIAEYELAIDTLEQTKFKRPTVFVYNDASCKEDESITVFRKKLSENRAYWRDYNDIDNLMHLIQEDLSSELWELLYQQR